MKFKQRGGTNVAENVLMSNSAEGNLENIKSLVSKGVNVNAKDKYGKTALMFSSENGHLEVVKYLVENGADVNAKDDNGKTAIELAKNTEIKNYLQEVKLIFSATNGNLAIVKYLVENGVNVNAKDKYGRTALMFSSENGHLEVVKFLVSKGADVNAKDVVMSRTALIFSSIKGHLEVVKFLVSKGADINARIVCDFEQSSFFNEISEDEYNDARIKNGQNVLMLSSESGHLEVVKFFVENGADINAQYAGDPFEPSGFSALILSSKNGHLEVVKYLVSKGANINATSLNRDKVTALMYSCNRGHLEITKFLVENGANVNARDNDLGHTALIYAIGLSFPDKIKVDKRIKLEMVKYLVEKGADIHVKKERINGRFYISHPAIQYSTMQGDLEITKFLVEKGADVTVKDNEPIYGASLHDNLELIKFLVEKGAGVNGLIDDEGLVYYKNPLIRSSGEGHLEIVKFLVSKGADINAKNQYGKTSLMFSSMGGHLEVVKFLISKGADVNIKDKDGKTAMDLAKTDEIKDVLNTGMFLLENINSKCNASKLVEADLLKIAKILKIDKNDINKENVCQKIEELFSKKSQEKTKKLEKKDKNKTYKTKCINDDTLLGTDLKDVHPMFFYTIKEKDNLFCGDIREFIKLESNPWTRTPFTKAELNKMKKEYDNLKTFVKNIDDREEVIQETIEITLRKAMSNVLNELSYTVDVEQYVNADDEKFDRFINSLTKEILSANDVGSLNTIKELPNKKLALANVLKVKLDNDRNVVISGGNKISELRSQLQEIYNNIFKLN